MENTMISKELQEAGEYRKCFGKIDWVRLCFESPYRRTRKNSCGNRTFGG